MRPRFRFSLRTLLIAVTLFSVWLGWEVYVVRQRKAVLRDAQTRLYVEVTKAAEYAARFPAGSPPPSLARVSLLRGWLGDEAIQELGVMPFVVKDPEVAQLKQWFPEASISQVRQMEPCHPGCFPQGTQILTVEGLRSIETVRAGDALVAFDRRGNRTAVPVTSVFTATNRLLEIETEHGTILTTAKQPLAESFSRHIAAGQLKAGDHLLAWFEDEPVTTRVLRVTKTGRIATVYNLVLEDSELFIAGGFLARSKPPDESLTGDGMIRRPIEMVRGAEFRAVE